MSKTFKGTLCALLAGCFWGVMSLFVEYFKSVGIFTMSVVFIRMAITSIFMLICLGIFKPTLLKIKIKDFWIFLGNGVLSLIMFSFCYFNSIVKSSAAIAAVLLYTAPVIVMFLSVMLFKEKLTKTKIFACAVAVIGCVLTSGIIGNSDKLSASGLLYGLGAGLGYALYSIFTRIAINKGYNPLTVIFYSFTVAFICCIPFTDLWGIFNVFSLNFSALVIALVMGFVSAILPYFLYTTALNNIESSKASIIASVELVVAAITGFIAFDQNPGILGIAGIILVIFAIVILNIKFSKSKES